MNALRLYACSTYIEPASNDKPQYVGLPIWRPFLLSARYVKLAAVASAAAIGTQGR